MQWPTLIVDNFFTDPHAVVKLSKTFKYVCDNENRWPGERTRGLHEEDPHFFQWSTRKILALLYPVQVCPGQDLKWKATQSFQRMPSNIYGKEGWIHSDDKYEFTAIIYLSDHVESGTCLYEGKQFSSHPTYVVEKQKFNRDLKDKKRMEKYRDKTNSQFRKKVELFSNFNRLVLFDGSNWHAHKHADHSKEDRLTLITFFTSVSGENLRYPITQMRRI